MLTSEKMLKYACEMVFELDKECGTYYALDVFASPETAVNSTDLPDYFQYAAYLLAGLANRVAAKATGKAAMISAAKRIAKHAKKCLSKDNGSFRQAGKCVIFDEQRAIRFNDDLLDIPCVEEEIKVERMTKAFGDSKKDQTVRLPAVRKLAEFVAIAKAIDQNPIIYLWDDGPCFNAEFLRDMLQALPDCIAYKSTNLTDPLYLTAANGDGVLYPLKPSEDSPAQASSLVTWLFNWKPAYFPRFDTVKPSYLTMCTTICCILYTLLRFA